MTENELVSVWFCTKGSTSSMCCDVIHGDEVKNWTPCKGSFSKNVWFAQKVPDQTWQQEPLQTTKEKRYKYYSAISFMASFHKNFWQKHGIPYLHIQFSLKFYLHVHVTDAALHYCKTLTRFQSQSFLCDKENIQ